MTRRPPSNAAAIDVSHDTLVRRFFPATNGYKVSLEGITPGRYWKKRDLRGDRTAFDDEVAKLIDGSEGPKFRDQHELDSLGTFCPFYTWRVHAISALMTASATRRVLTSTNLKNLRDEKDAWGRKIAQSKILLGFPDIGENIAARVHHQPSDYDWHTIPNHAEMMSLRSDRISNLKAEIKQEEIIIDGIDQQIDRITRLLAPWPDERTRPDFWKTSFYMQMASVWRHTTGVNPPSNESLFTKILSAATRVASHEAWTATAWGQGRTLREMFSNSPSGEGFRIGDNGLLCLETESDIASRGAAISSMIARRNRDKEAGRGSFQFLEAALILRDNYETPLATVMQYVVVRHLLRLGGYWSDELGIQLGWIDKDQHSVEIEINKVVQSTLGGDLGALVVLRAACTFNPQARSYIVSRMHRSPLLGPTLQEILDSLGSSAGESGGLVEMDGSREALEAAVMLLGTYSLAPGLELAH